MDIRSYDETDQDEVIALWDACGLLRPWNDPVKDIKRKLRVQRELFVVGVEEDKVVATAMAGFDGHRGWVNYLAVSPDHRRQGYGREIMSEVERLLRGHGCPKLNLQVRGSNKLATLFYEGIGYQMDDVVSMGKRLERDD